MSKLSLNIKQLIKVDNFVNLLTYIILPPPIARFEKNRQLNLNETYLKTFDNAFHYALYCCAILSMAQLSFYIY